MEGNRSTTIMMFSQAYIRHRTSVIKLDPWESSPMYQIIRALNICVIYLYHWSSKVSSILRNPHWFKNMEEHRRGWLLIHVKTWLYFVSKSILRHYNDAIMIAMASQFTSPMIVCSSVYSGTDQSKYQSSASLAFVRGIHGWPVNSPHKGSVTRKFSHLMTSSCCFA